MLTRAIGVAALALVSGCALLTEPERRAPRRILFIGNSLTETNNLPALVQAMADSAGLPLTVGSVLLGGANLADLWGGHAPAEIDRGWDVVVMQQGPTSRAVDRVELRMIAARYATRIRAMGGEPAMLMVWPASANMTDFAGISRSYRLAAEDIDGYLYPAGEAWLEVWRRNLSLPLYSGDGFHPSAYGTYAAALTIFAVTWDRSVVGTPARYRLSDFTSIWVNPVDARVIQEAVDEAARRHGRRPR